MRSSKSSRNNVSTKRKSIEVRGIPVEIVRKDIRNLHLGVYPPNGRVRVAAPLHIKDEAVRLAVISRLGWIHRQQDSFERQDRQSEREMITGESHYVGGRRYRFVVVEADAPPQSVSGTTGRWSGKSAPVPAGTRAKPYSAACPRRRRSQPARTNLLLSCAED